MTNFSDKVRKVFPQGIPKDAPISYLNKVLERVGLRAKCRFPGSGKLHFIELKDGTGLDCVYGPKTNIGCRKPFCRSLHGLSPWETKAEYENSWEPFYDELVCSEATKISRLTNTRVHAWVEKRKYEFRIEQPGDRRGGFLLRVFADANRVAVYTKKIGGPENAQMHHKRILTNYIVAIRARQGHFLQIDTKDPYELQEWSYQAIKQSDERRLALQNAKNP